MDPSNLALHSNLAACSIKEQEYEHALYFAEKGVQLKEEKAVQAEKKLVSKLYWRLGVCYSKLGRFGEARNAFEKGMKIEPNQNKLFQDELSKIPKEEPVGVTVVEKIPITVVESLPIEDERGIQKNKEDEIVAKEIVAPVSTFKPPQNLNAYTIFQMMRCPPQDMEAVQKYMFSLPVSVYKKLTAEGVEYDLLDFMINSALRSYNDDDYEAWCKQTISLLQCFQNAPKFSLARMMMSSNVFKLLELLGDHVSNSVREAWL